MSENQLYFAPMEGITGSIYRRAHHRIFGGVDRYYAPFIFTNPKGKISKKDLLEIAPEYNEGCRVVPQLLSNCAEDFIATAHTLKGLGYDEVNLNLGCPSSTVASKGRGSGFLGEKEALKAFLADIFEKTDMKISLKTRIGLNRADEFDDILDIYEAFPVEMLIRASENQNGLLRGSRYGAFRKQVPGCLFLFAIMGIYLQQQLMDVSVKNIQISVIG